MNVRNSIHVFLLIVATLALVMSGCGERQETPPNATAAMPVLPPPGTPITFSTLCAVCHGVRGEGNLALRSPSIAGLPEWYVRQELAKFRTDLRGTDPRDPDGQRMHAIARLLSPSDIDNLVGTIAAMPSHPTVNTLGGDARRGLTVYHEYCAACHRYNASGELAFKSAPLTGLQDWYLVDQLTKFRSGIRGAHPQDEDGAKMRLVTTSLNEQHDRDVVAYIAVLANQKP